MDTFLIRVRRKNYNGVVMTAVIAHRGSAQQERENTIAAFLRAKELGADGVEFDVQMTVDEMLVIHHDAEIPDIGFISQLSSEALPPWIPTLSEALIACEGMSVNAEIKCFEEGNLGFKETIVERLAEGVHGADTPPDLLVSSFDHGVLAEVRRQAPSVATGALIAPGRGIVSVLERLSSQGISAVHPFVLSVLESDVTEAHRQGLKVNVWTVNGPDDLERMSNFGVDSVITDDVQLARKVLKIGESNC
jgi:glycerophosphoryl diester phosphodiesterase